MPKPVFINPKGDKFLAQNKLPTTEWWRKQFPIPKFEEFAYSHPFLSYKGKDEAGSSLNSKEVPLVPFFLKKKLLSLNLSNKKFSGPEIDFRKERWPSFFYPRERRVVAAPRLNFFVSSSFDRFWWALRPLRLFSKSFHIYVPFQCLTPIPFDFNGNLMRLQSNVFAFWYDKSNRCYHVSLDFGAKEKKFVSEKSVLLRKSRVDSALRVAASNHWFFLRHLRLSAGCSNFFLNNNCSSSYFGSSFVYGAPLWFEEELPFVRRYGWNFYSKAATLSLNTSLSISTFDSSVLARRTPWICNIHWLASPIHDRSCYVSDFSNNQSIFSPELFFQWRSKGARWFRRFSARAFFLFWSQLRKGAGALSTFDLNISCLIDSYLIGRCFKGFGKSGFYSSFLLQFPFFFKLTGFGLSFGFNDSLMPSFKTSLGPKWKRVSSFNVFPERDFYLRHLRCRGFGNPWLSFPQKMGFRDSINKSNIVSFLGVFFRHSFSSKLTLKQQWFLLAGLIQFRFDLASSYRTQKYFPENIVIKKRNKNRKSNLIK